MNEVKMTARPWQPQDLLDDLQRMIDEQPDNYLNGDRTTLCEAKAFLEEYFADPKWIPVTERLPEIVKTERAFRNVYRKSGRVLCACLQADGKRMVKEGYMEFFNDYPKPDWKIPGTIHSVTHWMPLPSTEGLE